MNQIPCMKVIIEHYMNAAVQPVLLPLCIVPSEKRHNLTSFFRFIRLHITALHFQLIFVNLANIQ